MVIRALQTFQKPVMETMWNFGDFGLTVDGKSYGSSANLGLFDKFVKNEGQTVLYNIIVGFCTPYIVDYYKSRKSHYC